ncbi:MAG TPA: LamG domain-containing protein, partial [Thermomicrobiales bacterium]|nr:LamG domain-containing protein [Thermomicrobiales bacterium]
MNLLGYTDRLSAGPGDAIRFMVSSEHPTYRADLVRLIHGDLDPRGPGFKAEEIAAPFAGDYRGVVQPIPTGSCVVVPSDPRLAPAAGVTIQAWLMPTLRTGGRQAVFGRWSPAANAGYDLALNAEGHLVFRVGDGASQVERVTSGAALPLGAWSFVSATFDAASGRLAVDHYPIEGWPRDPAVARAERNTALRRIGAAEAPLAMAASWKGDGDGPAAFADHFNGKIDRPRLLGRALSEAELARLAAGGSPGDIDGAVAIWDFAQDSSSARVVDASPNGLHGRTINLPARAMTGANWTGDEMRAAARPAEYGAIQFHDDDLDDAGWASDFSFTVPEDLRSGVYAARLRAGDDEDFVPFIVRPRLGQANAPIAYLMPTFTYLAYADEHMPI